MRNAPRLIRLRRPPQLVRAVGPFVPAVSLADVDRAWESLRKLNPRYFDGPILHVLGTSRNGHGGVTIHVAETSYRFYAVQRPGLSGGLDCGVRPLGAKGICRLPDPDGGSTRYVMARRSGSVAFYPNEWEFAPGGGLEPSDEPVSCVLRELAEETDFEAATPPIAVALLYDPQALSWEVVHTLDVRPSGQADASHAWEHAERSLFRYGEWPEPLAEVARAMLKIMEPSQRH
jgi:8-oxo-dGTP pyrophosphatase MutT (NUDIX family)